MTLEDAARVAVRHFPDRQVGITMLAIAGPESIGWQETIGGDGIWIFSPADQAKYQGYASEGYLSWGYWQIFMPAHHDRLQRLTGSTDPAVWAAWLRIGENNGIAAREVYDSQGFGAWSVYNVGSYLSRMEAARMAYDTAAGRITEPLPMGPCPDGCRRCVVVQAGDTLSLIAAAGGMHLEQLIHLNPVLQIDPLAHVGDTLCLEYEPGAGPEPLPTEPIDAPAPVPGAPPVPIPPILDPGALLSWTAFLDLFGLIAKTGNDAAALLAHWGEDGIDGV